MRVERLDHLRLTVRDVEVTCTFYTQVLGMCEQRSDSGDRSLRFGNQTINLCLRSQDTSPHSPQPALGSAELCFITSEPLARVACHLRDNGVSVEDGPVEQTGARGPILSIYFRDPDENLIELSNDL
ncbi:MAG: VOC family protein [Candidatus Latescibacterota bacterium]